MVKSVKFDDLEGESATKQRVSWRAILNLYKEVYKGAAQCLKLEDLINDAQAAYVGAKV